MILFQVDLREILADKQQKYVILPSMQRDKHTCMVDVPVFVVAPEIVV